MRRAAQAENSPAVISAGVYVLSRAMIEIIPPGHKISIEKDMMPRWLEGGGMLAHITPGPFIDIGTPESYAAAQSVLAAWVEA